MHSDSAANYRTSCVLGDFLQRPLRTRAVSSPCYPFTADAPEAAACPFSTAHTGRVCSVTQLRGSPVSSLEQMEAPPHSPGGERIVSRTHTAVARGVDSWQPARRSPAQGAHPGTKAKFNSSTSGLSSEPARKTVHCEKGKRACFGQFGGWG